MTNEELTALRSLFREEVKNAVHTNEQRLRDVIREEVNAAVYSSEQRLRDYVQEAIKGSEQRLRDYVNDAIAPLKADVATLKGDVATLKGDVATLKGNIVSLNDSFNLLAVLQRTMQADLARLRADYAQIVLILDEATIKINDLQESQRNLEIKFDEGSRKIDERATRLREEIHNMLGQMASDFLALNAVTIQHLEMHEKRTIDQAHPRTYPHSA